MRARQKILRSEAGRWPLHSRVWGLGFRVQGFRVVVSVHTAPREQGVRFLYPARDVFDLVFCFLPRDSKTP